jgi:hypothetical protein
MIVFHFSSPGTSAIAAQRLYGCSAQGPGDLRAGEGEALTGTE